jgi:hypothetical protein
VAAARPRLPGGVSARQVVAAVSMAIALAAAAFAATHGNAAASPSGMPAAPAGIHTDVR